MAAWDNVKLPSAPDAPSYAAPLVNFAPLGELGSAYYQGQEQQRQLAIRNAFNEGLPTDPNTGQPDYRAAANKLFQLGAYDQGMNLLKMQYGQEGVQTLGNAVKMVQQEQGGGAVQQPGAPAAQPVPRVPTSTDDTAAANDPAYTIPKTQADRVNAPTVSPAPGGLSSSLQPQSAQPSSVQPQPVPQQVAQATPAPPYGTPAVGAPQGPSAAGTSAAARLVPPQYVGREMQWANRLDQAAAMINQAIAQGQVAGVDLKAAQENAKNYQTQAQQIRAALAPTEEEKNLRTGAKRDLTLQDLAIQNGEKQFQGIRAQNDQFTKDQKPMLGLSKSLLNDPAMYTGVGANRVLDFNRVKAALAGNPRAAAVQEMLQKVTATSALSQINLQHDQLQEAAGPGGGRIFSQQVDLVNKSIPQLEGTLQGNRALVEIQSRMGERAVDIHNMAVKYRAAHGYLDDGFQQVVSQYLDRHSLLNEEEQRNPSLLGAVTAPPGLKTAGQLAAYAQQMGLKPNDPIRLNDGTLTHVPQFGVR